jgi:hypothetical protein
MAFRSLINNLSFKEMHIVRNRYHELNMLSMDYMNWVIVDIIKSRQFSVRHC